MDGYEYLDVARLKPHPDNPRKDLGDLSELVESVKALGVMQNLTVVPDGFGEDGLETYRVLIGHRRLAAAKEAGLQKLPCTIARGMDIKDQVGVMLAENMQRRSLTPLEEAKAFQMMFDLGDSVEEIGKKTGFSEVTVRRRLEIAKLDEKVVSDALEGPRQYTLSDLLVLEKIKDVEKRNELLEKSRTSNDLKFNVQMIVDNERRKKKAETIVPLIEARGIKETPQEDMWKIANTLGSFSLDSEFDVGCIPKGVDYYEVTERVITFWKLKKMRERHEADPKLERGRKNTDFLGNIERGMKDRIHDFVAGIVEGNYGLMVRDEGIEEFLIKKLTGMPSFYGGWNGSMEYLAGPGRGQAETSWWREKLEACKPADWLLLWYVKEKVRYATVVFTGPTFNKAGAEAMKDVADVLKRWGFRLDDEQDVMLLEGTHPLYEVGDGE